MKASGTVNIIGGGIAGLTTALALKKYGIKYHLFEQSPNIGYENVGLGISANIFPILASLNLLEATNEIGASIQNLHFVTKELNYIKSLKLSAPPLSVNRKLFFKLLSNKLGSENVYLNMPKSINDFSDNDIVISAEGVNSATRKSIYPNLKLRNSNQMLWRGISKIKLDEKFKNAYHSFIGGNLRFAIIHTGGDYYSWYAIKPKEGQEPKIRDKELLKKLFSNYHSLVNAVIDQSEHIHFSTLVDINPKDRRNLAWFQNKRLMIGDAIHPTTPNMANGACLAMEDAYLLAQLLNNGDLGLDEIYKTIQQRRTKKIDRIVFRSWWFGKLLHQRNSMLSFLIIKGVSWTPQFFFDRIYAQVLMKD